MSYDDFTAKVVSDNARLKAEVERMTNLYDVTRTDALRNGEDAARLKAENERLREIVKAFIGQMENALEGMSHPVHGRFIRGVTNCEISPGGRLTLADARALTQQEGER